MAYPYEQIVQLDMETADGETMCFKVPFPDHMLINYIQCVEQTGDAVFHLDLYSREPACGGADSLSDDYGEQVTPAIYRWGDQLGPSTSNEEGLQQVEVTFSPWKGYVNHDEVQANRSPKLQKYYIYAKITVASPGNYTFALKLSAVSDLNH